ncbi:MAG TPA: GNAT family N-acetyltransferase [Dongiaceae bacterium]|nr:GNAT family N-acetyltransferase [Dongiaceae bacterium]
MAALSATTQLVAENDLTTADRARIRSLLTAAFPDHAALWLVRDFWGGPLEYRILLQNVAGQLAAHLGFARRLIRVNDRSVAIAGIAAVAILPDFQGQGLGRKLLSALGAILAEETSIDFGFLQCRYDVAGFYERSGFHRISQPVRSFDPDRMIWQTDRTAALILPVAAAEEDWPRGGIVDLMGMPW